MDPVRQIARAPAPGHLQMKASDIELDKIVIDIERKRTWSLVHVRFCHNKIAIKASMHCTRDLTQETHAQIKILRCLGFSDTQIKALNYE